ncbi:MAG: NAD(P)-dependent glycerol-3-phosphate dehydrogenase [Oscillospiraceae bacterium]|nr:NAD(P)-dependent glycerol-3-phosphate dehydrogenase [Oscillospiraceae bacterium]
MSQILIMGAGGFGTALAVMAHKTGHQVTMWSPFADEVSRLNNQRENTGLLPGVTIPLEITVTGSLGCLPLQDLVILATPSYAVRSAANTLSEANLPKGMPVVCVAKGLEAGTNKTLSDILDEELRQNPSVMLSGPSHAEEVARGVPTSIVAASRNRSAAELVQDMLMNETLRIYISDDVLGVEYGGAVKNVIALAAGILDGLNGGDNTKAALMTRGIAEISRLGVAMGAKAETFAGLSGMGDLIVTCSSNHSRNRRCGILIGQGTKPEQAVKEIGMTVEGYFCTKAAYELSVKYKIDMPIVREIHAVLYQNIPVQQAIRNLMERPKRHESEAIWLLTR